MHVYHSLARPVKQPTRLFCMVPALAQAHRPSLLTFRAVCSLVALRTVTCTCTRSRGQNVNTLLRVLSGQKLSDPRLNRKFAQSVRLLETNISPEALLAWKELDAHLSSSHCPSPLHDFLAKKIWPVPLNIEHSQCVYALTSVTSAANAVCKSPVALCAACHCLLTLRPFGYHFQHHLLNDLVSSLFTDIPTAVKKLGLPQVLGRHAVGIGLLFHDDWQQTEGTLVADFLGQI